MYFNNLKFVNIMVGQVFKKYNRNIEGKTTIPKYIFQI